MKNIRVYFYLKMFVYLEVKFSIYLNTSVFVMNTDNSTPLRDGWLRSATICFGLHCLQRPVLWNTSVN